MAPHSTRGVVHQAVEAGLCNARRWQQRSPAPQAASTARRGTAAPPGARQQAAGDRHRQLGSCHAIADALKCV